MEIILVMVVFLQLHTVGFMIYGIHLYVKARRMFRIIARKMECDDLLDQLLNDTPIPSKPEAACEQTTANNDSTKRTRLTALTAGGLAKISWKGSPLSTDRVDKMTDDEVAQAYARYEAHLGAAMTKSLGGSLLRLYASGASLLLPLPAERQSALVADLEEDPFVSSALSNACCELYYRYSMYLAPLTAALATAKHCDWAAKQPLSDSLDSHLNIPPCDGYGIDDGIANRGETTPASG